MTALEAPALPREVMVNSQSWHSLLGHRRKLSLSLWFEMGLPYDSSYPSTSPLVQIVRDAIRCATGCINCYPERLIRWSSRMARSGLGDLCAGDDELPMASREPIICHLLMIHQPWFIYHELSTPLNQKNHFTMSCTWIKWINITNLTMSFTMSSSRWTNITNP